MFVPPCYITCQYFVLTLVVLFLCRYTGDSGITRGPGLRAFSVGCIPLHISPFMYILLLLPFDTYFYKAGLPDGLYGYKSFWDINFNSILLYGYVH